MPPIKRIETIAEFHRSRQLAPPEHPLISIVDYAAVQLLPEHLDCRWVFDFYFISLKKNIGGKIRYGQQSYDFDEGVMFFIAPGQVFGIERTQATPVGEKSGWMLLLHPDFLWRTPLATTIRKCRCLFRTSAAARFFRRLRPKNGSCARSESSCWSLESPCFPARASAS